MYSNHDCKGFNMIYHSTQFAEYLGYVILRGKQKKIKHIRTSEYKVLSHFNWSEQLETYVVLILE